MGAYFSHWLTSYHDRSRESSSVLVSLFCPCLLNFNVARGIQGRTKAFLAFCARSRRGTNTARMRGMCQITITPLHRITIFYQNCIMVSFWRNSHVSRAQVLADIDSVLAVILKYCTDNLDSLTQEEGLSFMDEYSRYFTCVISYYIPHFDGW